jgi:hypothetical protein
MNQRDKIRKLVREYCKKTNTKRVDTQLAYSIVWDHMGTNIPPALAVSCHLKGAKDFQWDPVAKIHRFLGEVDEDNPPGMD